MSDEGILGRWSRLKRQGDDTDAATAPPEPEPVDEPQSAEEEAALLQSLGLPDPDKLAPGDDFSAFMKENVPHFLRRRALRVLWRSNPGFAGLDGLVDYGDDFRNPESLAEAVQTAYRVGKGFLRSEEEPDQTPEEKAPPEPEPEEMAEAAPAPPPEVEAPAEMSPPDRPERVPTAAEPEPPTPRRMVFSLE